MAGKGKPGPAPGQRFGGRKKGTPNKLSGDVKAMILAALDKAGGVDYLLRQSTDCPTAFLALVGKVLPLTLSSDGTPITIKIIKYDDADDDWQPPIIEHEPPQLPASEPALPASAKETDDRPSAKAARLPDRGADEVCRLLRF
jgi:hypothetical protein